MCAFLYVDIAFLYVDIAFLYVDIDFLYVYIAFLYVDIAFFGLSPYLGNWLGVTMHLPVNGHQLVVLPGEVPAI